MIQAPFQVPVIDISPLIRHSPTSINNASTDYIQTSIHILRACRDVGFFFIKNHEISLRIIDELFEQTKWFFSLPFEEKLKSVAAPGGNGYMKVEAETLNEEAPKDLKEVFQLRCESGDVDGSGICAVNKWPKEADATKQIFRETLNRASDSCFELQHRILQAIALGLRLPTSTYFRDNHCRTSNYLRLLHYPPITDVRNLKDYQTRAGAHTDWGTLTLLFQERHSEGLEVQLPSGEWISARLTDKHEVGADGNNGDGDGREKSVCALGLNQVILVNVGDLLKRWTNGLFHAAMHRVVVQRPIKCERADNIEIQSCDAPYPDPKLKTLSETTSNKSSVASRYSIVFFIHPDEPTLIDTLPSPYIIIPEEDDSHSTNTSHPLPSQISNICLTTTPSLTTPASHLMEEFLHHHPRQFDPITSLDYQLLKMKAARPHGGLGNSKD